MNEKRPIVVAFASDDRYASYTGIAIQSMCEQAKSSLHVVVLEDRISEDNKKKIEKAVSGFSNVELQWISVDIDNLFAGFVLVRDITLSTYSRFLLPKYFPNEDRLMYVDGDVVFLKDVSNIVHELDDEHIIAAAVAPQSDFTRNLCRGVGISSNHQWFYSGCLVINCRKWNESNIFEKIFAAQQKYSGKIHFGDQDLLNIVFDNNYSPLNEIYSATNNEITEDLHRRAVIRHFEGGVKPWKQHPLKIWAKRYKAKYKGLWEFWKVAIRSPFKDELFAKYPVERWIIEKFIL